MLESNQRQSACKTGALPTELIAYILFGLTDENRTHNRQNHNLELYQLSYRQHLLVGRGGVEPPQESPADLQSVGLATCSASPHSLLILYHALGAKVNSLFNLF